MNNELPPQQAIEIFSKEHVDELERRQREAGTPTEFLLALIQKFGEQEVHNSLIVPMVNLSYAKETDDPVKDSIPRESFYIGSLIGIEAIHIVGGEDIVSKIATDEYHFSIPLPESASHDEIAEAASVAIAEVGVKGYQRADNFRSLVESWEQAWADTLDVEYFRRGFGVMMHLSDVMTFDEQRKAMIAAATAETDFDAELALLGLLDAEQLGGEE